MRHCLLIVLLFGASLFSQVINLQTAGAATRSYGPASAPTYREYPGGIRALTMTATFLATSGNRACWDLPITADLTHCSGVTLRFCCTKTDIVRQFNVYLKTGNTWQTADFTPVATNQWQEIFIPKAAFMPEGETTSSWKNGSLLRLALWKGAPGQTHFILRDLVLETHNVPAAIIRSGTSAEAIKESYAYAQNISNALERAGIRPAVIDEADTTYLNLRPYTFLYLPCPSASSPLQEKSILSFIKRGGKLAVFHALPPMLQQAMQLPTGKFTPTQHLGTQFSGVAVNQAILPNAQSFNQASTSFIAVADIRPPLQVAAYWRNADGSASRFPAIIASPFGFWMTHVFLNKDTAHAPAVLAAMLATTYPKTWEIGAALRIKQTQNALNNATWKQREAAKQTFAAADSFFKRGNFPEAIRTCDDCQAAIANASVQAVPKRPNEIRAIWCPHETGLQGSTWKKTVPFLAQADFNAVFPYGGAAYLAGYPSAVTPFIRNTDNLAECTAECRKLGVQVHVWINCLNFTEAYKLPQAKNLLDSWKQQGRFQKTANGETLPWLCPSQIRNHDLVVRFATEIAQRYPVDGIHLDFIRFPQSDSCFCHACKRAFETFLGQPVPAWPQDAQPHGRLYAAWCDFRQKVITRLVLDVSYAVRQARKGIKLSTAVYPEAQAAAANVGQDWRTWLTLQCVDFICPMTYQQTTDGFAAQIGRQVDQAGIANASKILPGIGVSNFNMTADDAKRQLFAARKARTAGVILFKLDSREALEVVPKVFKNIP